MIAGLEGLLNTQDWEGLLKHCLQVLSQEPNNHPVRIHLARAFFELGFVPFAAREIDEVLKHNPDNRQVKRLLAKLSPDKLVSSEHQDEEEIVLSETDFTVDDLTVLTEKTR